MTKKVLLSSILLVGSLFPAKAQYDLQSGALLDGKTLIKTNLISDVIRSYNISAERFLTKNLSIQVGFSTMPKGDIPLIPSFVIEKEESLRNAKFGSTSFTLDLRLYLSKTGYGHGFYLQPYFRHESHSLHDLKLKSTIEHRSGSSYTYPGYYETYEGPNFTSKTNLKANSFGLALGAQWLIGKNRNIAIDWTILGLHYGGTSKFYLEAEPIQKYSNPQEWEQDAEAYSKDIEQFTHDHLDSQGNTEISLDAKTLKVSATTKVLYLFLRTGLSIGFRF